MANSDTLACVYLFVNKPIYSKGSKRGSLLARKKCPRGKKRRITVGDRKDGGIPVKTYREILDQYLYHPESKFAGTDGHPSDPWTRGVLQRRHIIAADFKYCGKEVKRKLEQGPVDRDLDFKCKVYENGRVGQTPKLSDSWKDFQNVRLRTELGCTENQFGCLSMVGP